MATYSTAFIPTNRTPGEYIMSEGWSNGMLYDTGLSWYRSTPRMDDAIRATMLLGGSPVFAPAGDIGLDIKEIDYIEEGITDAMAEEDDDFVEGVATTLEALELGNWATAENTAYGAMTLEAKMAMGITNNTSLHKINDFSDLPAEYGATQSPHLYNLPVLMDALKQYDAEKSNGEDDEHDTADVACWYFYHTQNKQWWGQVVLPDNSSMYVPLVVAFAIEGGEAFEEVQALHNQYPMAYAKDIAALTQFQAALQS